MSSATDLLRTYVSDMLALERHLHEAIHRQVNDGSVRDYPQAKSLIDRLHSTTRSHVDALENHVRILGGQASGGVKETVTSMLGAAAGVIDKVRAYPVSKMLRDDYTAVSMAAISYTMLHTTALALRDQATAELARKQLQNWTPLIVEISETIPYTVVDELERDSQDVSPNVAEQAVKNTHQTWTREAIARAA